MVLHFLALSEGKFANLDGEEESSAPFIKMTNKHSISQEVWKQYEDFEAYTQILEFCVDSKLIELSENVTELSTKAREVEEKAIEEMIDFKGPEKAKAFKINIKNLAQIPLF